MSKELQDELARLSTKSLEALLEERYQRFLENTNTSEYIKLELAVSSGFYGSYSVSRDEVKVLGRPNTFSIIHFLQLQID